MKSPTAAINLGVIVENSKGAEPDTAGRRIGKRSGGHGMMKRLNTEEWNEQKDMITMAKPRRLIR